MTSTLFDFVDETWSLADRTLLPVAVGGSLTEGVLLAAYRRGVVVMPADGPQTREQNRQKFGSAIADGLVTVLEGPDDPFGLTWWFPWPRYILRPTAVRRQRNAEKRARLGEWALTLDSAFVDVVSACSEGRRHVWMNTPYRDAVTSLFHRGIAHSVEVWQGDDLVGGTFGVVVGALFVCESVFNRVDDAGKVAVTGLSSVLHHSGIQFIDWQFHNPLGATLGIEVVDDRAFAQALVAPSPQIAGIPQFPFDVSS